jgi:hypothetical protein
MSYTKHRNSQVVSTGVQKRRDTNPHLGIIRRLHIFNWAPHEIPTSTSSFTFTRVHCVAFLVLRAYKAPSQHTPPTSTFYSTPHLTPHRHPHAYAQYSTKPCRRDAVRGGKRNARSLSPKVRAMRATPSLSAGRKRVSAGGGRRMTENRWNPGRLKGRTKGEDGRVRVWRAGEGGDGGGVKGRREERRK